MGTIKLTLLSCLLLSIFSSCVGEEPVDSRSANFQSEVWKNGKSENNACLCYGRANAPLLPTANNQDVKRLVVYYYYTDSGPTYIYVPDKLKQLSIPSVYEEGDKIEPLAGGQSCSILDLYRNEGVTPINTAQYVPSPEVHPTNDAPSQVTPVVKYYDVPNAYHGFPQQQISYIPGQRINGIIQYEVPSTQKPPIPVQNLTKFNSSDEFSDKDEPHSDSSSEESSEEIKPNTTSTKIIHKQIVVPGLVINKKPPQPWHSEYVISPSTNQQVLSEILPLREEDQNLRPESMTVSIPKPKIHHTINHPKQPMGLIWGPESLVIPENPIPTIKKHYYPIDNTLIERTKNKESEIFVVPSTITQKNKWILHRPIERPTRPTAWEIPGQQKYFKPNRIIRPNNWAWPQRKISKGKLTIYDYPQQSEMITPQTWKIPEKSSYISQVPSRPIEQNVWKQPESFDWTTIHTQPIRQNIGPESWKIWEKFTELPDTKEYLNNYDVIWPTQPPIHKSWMIKKPSKEKYTPHDMPIRPENVDLTPEAWIIPEDPSNNPKELEYPINLTPTEATQITNSESWSIPETLIPTVPSNWNVYEDPSELYQTQGYYTMSPKPLELTSTIKPEIWAIPESSITKKELPARPIVESDSRIIIEKPIPKIEEYHIQPEPKEVIQNTKPDSWKIPEKSIGTNKPLTYEIPVRPNDINMDVWSWAQTVNPNKLPESHTYPNLDDLLKPTYIPQPESFVIPETTTLENKIQPDDISVHQSDVNREPQSWSIQDKPSYQPKIIEYPIHREQTSEPPAIPIQGEYPVYENLPSQVNTYSIIDQYHKPDTWFSPDRNWDQIQPEASQMLVKPTPTSVHQNIRPSEYIWTGGDSKRIIPQSYNQAYMKWLKIIKPSTITISKQEEIPYLLPPDFISWNKIKPNQNNGSQWPSMFEQSNMWNHMTIPYEQNYLIPLVQSHNSGDKKELPESYVIPQREKENKKEPVNSESSSEENSAFFINGIGYQANTGLVSSKSIYLSKQRPIILSQQNSKYVITFDEWLQQQMKRLIGEGKTPNLNAQTVKSLIEKTLYDNGMYLTKHGFIVNSKGKTIDMSNLKLRPILIGSSLEYAKLLEQSKDTRKFKLPENLPYLKAVLVSLVNPPKILGIIALGKTYLPTAGAQVVKTSGSAGLIPTSLSQGNKIPTNNEYNYNPDAPQYRIKNRPSKKHNSHETSWHNARTIIENLHPSLLNDLTTENFTNEESVESEVENDVPQEQVPGENNPLDWNDSYPGFRIIGGHAATSSGYPLSNKGRQGRDR